MSDSSPTPTSLDDRAVTAGFDAWLAALASRHLADLRLQEVTRALRALSAAYVQRRGGLERGAPLDSAGKRAAFALYYAPLHFLTLARIVAALRVPGRPVNTVLDLGCGTGVAGAAIALAAGGAPVLGLDRHPWALREARWTYRQFALAGRTRQSDLARLPPLRPPVFVVAAYVLNELGAPLRARVETQLLAAAARGGGMLVVEPIARRLTPWWGDMAARVTAAGGRADEWRFSIDLPAPLRVLDEAAGLDHRELTARTLFLTPGGTGAPA